MTTRHNRLRAIRLLLRELLQSGRIEVIARERAYPRYADVRLHVQTLLELATRLEHWTPEQKQGAAYREMAGFVASELEQLRTWIRE